jgi:hypothetical protein
MSFFTHYWTKRTWDATDRSSGQRLNHAAGNLFRKRNVCAGDTVYAISAEDGQLRLIGRLRVGRILGQRAAERVMQKTLWPARDHCIAEPGSATKIHSNLVLRELRRAWNGVSLDLLSWGEGGGRDLGI